MIPIFRCRACGTMFDGSLIYSHPHENKSPRIMIANYIREKGGLTCHHECGSEVFGVADFIAVRPWGPDKTAEKQTIILIAPRATGNTTLAQTIANGRKDAYVVDFRNLKLNTSVGLRPYRMLIVCCSSAREGHLASLWSVEHFSEVILALSLTHILAKQKKS